MLPFDDLTGTGETDRGASALLAASLRKASTISAIATDSLEDGYALRADGFLSGYYAERNGTVDLHARLEDSTSHKVVSAFDVHGPAAAGLPPLLMQVASRLDKTPQPIQVSSGAYVPFSQALQARTPEDQDRDFEAAIAAEPKFSLAYLAWAQQLLARGDKSRAAEVASRGLAGDPDPIARQRLAFLAAAAGGDIAGETGALRQLSTLEPANAGNFEELGRLDFDQRNFAQSAKDYREVTKLDPRNGSVYNVLGYSEAYAGNLAGARQALSEYRRLEPAQEVNALDSIGEVNFFLGDFAAAESSFLAAHAKNPGAFDGLELRKAAEARLMTGDVPGANGLFGRYVQYKQLLPGGSLAVQQAQWDFLTGQRRKAIAKLQAAAPAANGDASALMFSQLAIWQLQTGDRSAAQDSAQKAAQQASSPAMQAIANVCRFLAHPPSASSGSEFVDALVALFNGDFAAAKPKLESLFAKTSPSNDAQMRVLLAWSSLKTGDFAKAGQLLRLTPLPLESGESIFASLVFPRLLEVKGAVLAHDGKQAESQRASDLFRKLSGDLPDRFGP